MPMPQTSPPKQLTASLPRSLVWGLVAGLGLAVVGESLNVLGGRNTHVVIPGVLYRCAQPSSSYLSQLIRKHGIRTVVNLRGICDSKPWFLDQARVTAELGVSQEDLAFSAGRLPHVAELRQLVEVLDRSEYPILLHC